MVNTTTDVVKNTTNRVSLRGMMENIEKPKEPKSTPEEKQVSEVQEPEPGSSKEVRPDESAEKLKTMESELGRLRQEIGDERKKAEELNAYKLYYEQQQRQSQQQQQQQKQNFDEQWFDKPTETFEHLSQQRDMKMIYQQAYQQAPMAKAMAKMQNPAAFEGITDTELEQAMFGGVQSGTTNPAILGDPNAWTGAAWILRGPKTGYKMPDLPPAGMSPAGIETPSSPHPGAEQEIPEIRGDDLTDALMGEFKKLGITKEDALKEVQATRDMEGE